MPWIRYPGDEDTPAISRATRAWRDEGRQVPAVIAPMKHAPRTMRGVLQMNGAVTFGGSSLGQRDEELLATAVSAVNDCFY